MINIDLHAFSRHHYWFGWYHWNSCDLHKNFKSGCPYCEEGEWKYIEDAGEKSRFTIFKMPMNNVLWTSPNEDD